METSLLESLQKKLQPNQNILAVSKLQPVDKIITLAKQGQKNFGENYIQEALDKINQLKHLNLNWHLIGPIQKNKVKFLKDNFEYIHSVDSLKLAESISLFAEKINYIQKIFIQINISNEITKSGFNLNNFKKDWDHLKNLKNIKIIGLMTMPPLQNEPEQSRPLFKELKNVATDYQLTELSMGTSHDFKVALSEGSTWIRLGTMLFGDRSK